MRAVSCLKDNRINSSNYLVELNVEEYLNFAEEIIQKNEYQRKRVRSSKTVYSLLKKDLKTGCIMPPLVLAIASENKDKPDRLENFDKFLEERKEDLIILDGLQRTYTIIDLISEIKETRDEDSLRKILSHKIRAEFYVGLNRLGILYRMLTLNTGQTPMSLRQQIEILYLDYARVAVDGIELIREADDRKAAAINQYNFKDIVEGFNSYLERNELPIDRVNLLENIKSLEKLAMENQETDIFEGYIRAWNLFMRLIGEVGKEAEIDEDYIVENGTPFGKNLVQVFKKPQAMSGFGAAVGKMKDFEILDGFNKVSEIIPGIKIDDPQEFLENINRALDWIKNNTKKIGNAQRSYFQYFFREILNPENESYQDPSIAYESALKKYQSQNM